MTTHNVEIRFRPTAASEPRMPWVPITRMPIAKRDAENLASMIGPDWESRIVALEAPMGQDFGELERLFNTNRRAAVVGRKLERWEKVRINHHPDCSLQRSHQLTHADQEFWETHELGKNPTDILGGEEWVTLQILADVKALMDSHEGVTIVIDPPRVHRGHCTCGGAARAISVRVAIDKHQPFPAPSGEASVRSSSREYACAPITRTPL